MSDKNLSHLSEEIRQIERQFKENVEPYRSDLWRYCYRLTGSAWDAEDLVQDTLLKSLSVLAKLYQPVNTKAYLFRIATNLWIDQQRKRNGKLAVSDFEHSVVDQSSEIDYLLIENVEVLVQQLTPIQYVTLLLAEVFQFKGKEIAEITHSTEGAVHTNISRARQTLRQLKAGSGREKVLSVRELSPTEPIGVLLNGLRNKDPDMILSVLGENIVADITHAGMEIGKDELKKNSLKDWKEVVDQQNELVCSYIQLWGRPVIAELERKEDTILYLNNIYYIEESQNEITYWKYYCFSWDLMNAAAEELKVKLNAEYFYHIF